MRILLATGIYPPDIGGPATYAAQLFEHLPKRGIEVRVVTYADRKLGVKHRVILSEAKDLGVAPHSTGSFGVRPQDDSRKVIFVSRKIPKGLRHLIYFFKTLWYGGKADIIYALDTVSAGLPAAAAAKILGKSFVVKVVGDYAWEQYQMQNAKCKMQSYNSKFKSIETFQNERYDLVTETRRKIQNFVVRSARIVVTPSEYLKTIIVGWGIMREKITVIPNAVIVPDVLPTREEARVQLGLHGTILLSAGRLVPWKGVRTLIGVMAEIKKHVPEAQLLIIGSGPEGEALKAHVRAEALEANVKLIGSVPRDALWQYVRASDIFVLNTAYEGFSHQIIEAMAAGVPVITTAIGGNPEIIEDGKEGFLVPHDDAETFRETIVSLLEDKSRYAEIQQRAREKAMQFSLERMLKAIIEILTAIRG